MKNKANDFELKDQNGSIWRLSDHRGKVVVLLFYPGDNTTVCTKQLCSVRDNWEDYAATGAVVVGISTDDDASHKGFAEKYNLPLTLLADTDGRVSKMYEMTSWLPGRSARGVVVINAKGDITYSKAQTLSIFRPDDKDVIDAIRAAA